MPDIPVKPVIRSQTPLNSGITGQVLAILKVSPRKYAIMRRVSTTRDDATGVDYSVWEPMPEHGKMTWLKAFNKIIELKRG